MLGKFLEELKRSTASLEIKQASIGHTQLATQRSFSTLAADKAHPTRACGPTASGNKYNVAFHPMPSKTSISSDIMRIRHQVFPVLLTGIIFSACSHTSSNSTLPGRVSLGATFSTTGGPQAPVPGKGPAGAQGPFNTGPIGNRPNSATFSPSAQMPPLPLPAILDISAYHVNPRILRARVSRAIIHPETAASPASPAPAARMLRTQNLGASNTFTGDSDTDIPASTDGNKIATFESSNFYVYSTTGSLLKKITVMSFYCGGTNNPAVCSSSGFPGDDRVIYDPGSNRWIATALWVNQTSTPATDMLAVSQTNDPTGAWYVYSFPACGAGDAVDHSDQPHTGFNNQWVVTTSACTVGYTGLAVFDKANLYSGGALNLNTTWWEFVDNVESGNRDNPARTYTTTINNREYLTAGMLSNGQAAVLYSHVEGATNSPTFYPSTDLVTTGINAGSPTSEDAPGCTGCIGTYSNGWIHSSGVWAFSGSVNIISTVVFSDPNTARSNQIINVTTTDNGIATAEQVLTGVAGSGPLASEISAPLVQPLADSVALFTYDYTGPGYYPGVQIGQWDADANNLDWNNGLQAGTLTPTGSTGGRWVDFIDALNPVPGTSNMVFGAQLAVPSSTDSQRATLFGTVSPKATPTPRPCVNQYPIVC